MRKRVLSSGLPMLAATVLAGASVNANAAMVTYSVDAGATLIPATTSSVSGVSYTDTVTLPKFNPAMGTLTDASFHYNYAAAVDAEGGGGAVGQVGGGELFLNGNDTGLSANGGGFSGGGVSALSGGFTGTYDDPNLSQDTGVGNVTFAWDTTGDYITIAYGSPTATLEATTPSPVSVTYTYTAVPEPALMGLIDTGAVMLLARRRRR